MSPENLAIGRAAVLLWAGLAFVAILLMTAGAIWLICRFGRRVRGTRRPAPRVVYFDLSLSNGPETDAPPLDDDADEPKPV